MLFSEGLVELRRHVKHLAELIKINGPVAIYVHGSEHGVDVLLRYWGHVPGIHELLEVQTKLGLGDCAVAVHVTLLELKEKVLREGGAGRRVRAQERMLVNIALNNTAFCGSLTSLKKRKSSSSMEELPVSMSSSRLSTT